MLFVDERIKYWVDISDYDLETAKALMESKRYLYVGFMCHQAIEKILKAYYVKSTGSISPFSHSLTYLANKSGLYDYFDEDQKQFVDQVEPLNIEARYPTNKEELLKSLTFRKCTELLEKTNSLQRWIKKKLS